ncbi:MAG: Acetyl-CoA synthetase [uncultured Thermomicrobiales bacterium]|uniref:Acetyl-coenzyme A synthetase n=1 Tax=uncultured Thermomicrobiales bacterium TaxID=1645740 RepID=A0A6J4U8S0_9BACT|nr:MAG: Acetyl-CoA synthetase [uncultured Thermomicrobiales bacterium]
MAEGQATGRGAMAPGTEYTIEALASEERTFPPPPGFAAQAVANDRGIYARAEADLEGFWAEEAARLDWFTPWDRVLDWNPPDARWFDGGELNVSYNCLDRHVAAGRGDKVAFYWEGEPGDQRVTTYAQLLDDVGRCANALKALGVRRGDRVAIYMPMIPEMAVAMLACARIGAPHTVVFGGFSAEALRDRINDAEAKLVVTADGGYRRGKPSGLKAPVDAALADGACPSVEKVLVVRRTGQDVTMADGRDVWWHDLVPGQDAACEPERMASEDLLYLLYTSGTTAKPKGIVHTTAGYLVGVSATHRYVFDIKDDDVYWCAADLGWVTGHSYILYGPLANGSTGVMYEGTPDHPAPNRWWDIVERYKVSVLYTAPTAIRAHMKWGPQHAAKHDLSSLRLLGSVGEPINPEAWIWYHRHIGGERCPIVDTWWQTETGAIMISPLPGLTTTKPGSATVPFPGVDADVVDADGHSVPKGQGGYLVLRKPWPSMLRGIYGDPERFRETYWSRYPGLYFPGDGAKRDEDGYFWLMGRVDDVMNVSGHRLSTTEIESALVSHDAVAEAAVVGVADPLTGEAPAAFVILKLGAEPSPGFGEHLRQHVAAKIGPIAKPKTVMFTPDLPKTRSGKIMRRLLRDIAAGRALGDTTTLADATVVEQIRDASAAGKDEE